VVCDSSGGATSDSKMSKLAYYKHVQYTLGLMYAKNCAIIFYTCSFLHIRENVEWPRFFGPLCICDTFWSTGAICQDVFPIKISLNSVYEHGWRV